MMNTKLTNNFRLLSACSTAVIALNLSIQGGFASTTTSTSTSTSTTSTPPTPAGGGTLSTFLTNVNSGQAPAPVAAGAVVSNVSNTTPPPAAAVVAASGSQPSGVQNPAVAAAATQNPAVAAAVAQNPTVSAAVAQNPAVAAAVPAAAPAPVAPPSLPAPAATGPSLAPTSPQPSVMPLPANPNQFVSISGLDNTQELATKAIARVLSQEGGTLDDFNIPQGAFGRVLEDAIKTQGRIDNYVHNLSVQRLIESMNRLNKDDLSKHFTFELWKALDHPHYARQALLARALHMRNQHFIQRTAEKVITDITPGSTSPVQIAAVVSAARSAAQYGDLFKEQIHHEDHDWFEAFGEHGYEGAFDADKVQVTPNSCVPQANILSSLPAGCVIYTISVYGKEGINQFYQVNINGQLQPLLAKSMSFKGPVKYSITYSCPGLAPANPDENPMMSMIPNGMNPANSGSVNGIGQNGVQSNPNNAQFQQYQQQLQAQQQQLMTQKQQSGLPMTLANLDCDSQGFKDSQGYFSGLAVVNGALSGQH